MNIRSTILATSIPDVYSLWSPFPSPSAPFDIASCHTVCPLLLLHIPQFFILSQSPMRCVAARLHPQVLHVWVGWHQSLKYWTRTRTAPCHLWKSARHFSSDDVLSWTGGSMLFNLGFCPFHPLIILCILLLLLHISISSSRQRILQHDT